MALPSTGSISMNQINIELGRASGTNISLDAAENGSYGAINQNSVAKPSSGNPASMSEWRGYNHGCGQVAISGLSSGIICNGNTILLVAYGMTSYTWTIPGVGTVSSDTLQLTPGSAGYPSVNGTVTYTVVGTSTGCSSTASRSVTVKPIPSVSIAPDSVTINQGQSTTLTASGASTYSWNTGATGASITVSPSSTTTYTVTGTSADGCSAQASRTVTVIPATTTTTCPPAGTLLGTYCIDTQEWGQYADGNCGIYDAMISDCSANCGCQPPECILYNVGNTGEGPIVIEYTDCAGTLRQLTIEPGNSFEICIQDIGINVIDGDPAWLEAKPLGPCGG